MILFLLAFVCLWANKSYSQAVYVDPTTSAAILSTGAQQRSMMRSTNDRLTLIQRGQLAITGQLTVANDIQNKIYAGLSQVSSAVRNLMGVKQASEYVIRIADNVTKTVEIAQDNPVLLLFAEKNAQDFKARALELSLYITQFALKEGGDNLMDAGERAKIIRHIVDELKIMNANAYGMHRSMFYAKQNGILRSLNPWVTWSNQDALLARGVIRDMQYLQK